MIHEGKKKIQNNFLVEDNPLCIGNPSPAKIFGTRKVVQLTGDFDRELGQKTINQTGRRFGIYGTDLGVSFLHEGKLYFLFGDTNRNPTYSGLPIQAMPGEDYNEEITDYDSVAYTTSDRAYNGINLIFNSDYPHLEGVAQMTGEHPIEGFSKGGYMYVYFTTDLYPDEKVPTRTVLARSKDGGIHFGKPIYTLSTDKFIHVSAQIVDNNNIYGIPDTKGEGLLIWGTSKHRKSDIYLAYIPLDQITNRSRLQFFMGLATESSEPMWGPDESVAKPLFSAQCMGEISVRWNQYLERWIMLYNCELCNTSGILFRLANRPWGPWSPPKIMFDPVDAYGKYIHQPGSDNLYDYGRNRPKDRGDEYGPYQISPFSTGIKGRYTKIYFTMSTWNPYQVVQMSSIITSDEEERNHRPYANDVNDRNDRKYAHISVLLAHLAKIYSLSFENSIQDSIYIADHVEWAQYHSSAELRNEIKNKCLRIITNLGFDEDKSEAYAIIVMGISSLAYDYNSFKNISKGNIHKRWALNAIQSGHSEWLISEIKQKIDNSCFLPSNDYLCYAYDCHDSNEFKYARIGLLVSFLAANVSTKLDLKREQLVNCNSFVAWARFRSVKEIREDLLNMVTQIIKFPSTTSKANAYTEIIHVIQNLANTTHSIEHSNYYEWASSKINENNEESIIMDISKLINDDHFLSPIAYTYPE